MSGETIASEASVESRANTDDPLAARPATMTWRSATFHWLWLTVLLAALRYEVLLLPPSYDFAVGIFPEAEFLARTNFDYLRLRNAEKHSLDEHGGPRSYLTSAMPTVYALITMASPSIPVALAIYHLGTIACGAATMVTLYATLAPIISRRHAFLVATASLVAPAYCVQLDMTGMEAPLTLAVVAMAAALSRDRVGLAILWSCVAVLIKPSGLVATVALTTILVVRAALQAGSGGAARASIQAVVAGIVLFGQYRFLVWGGDVNRQIRDGLPIAMTLAWAPDLIIVAATVIAVGSRRVARAVSDVWRNEKTHGVLATIRPLARWAVFERPLVPFATLFAVGIVVASSRVGFIPRYLAAIVPMLYSLLGLGLFDENPNPNRGRLVFAALIALSIMNWDARLSPDQAWLLEKSTGVPPAYLADEPSLLERSHEYLAELTSAIAATKILETYSHEPIVAPTPFNYALAYPNEGYVKSFVPGYSINGFRDAAPAFKDWRDLLREMPARPIFIRAANFFAVGRGMIDVPPPGPDDEILFQAEPPRLLTVYRKGWADGPPTASDLNRYYERIKFPGTRFGWRIAHALKSGSAQDVYAIADEEARAHPALPDPYWIKAAVARKHGQHEIAREAALVALDRSSAEEILEPRLPHQLPLPKGAVVDERARIAKLFGEPDGWWRAIVDRLRLRDLPSAIGYAKAELFNLPELKPIVQDLRKADELRWRGDKEGAKRLLGEILKARPSCQPARQLQQKLEAP